MPLRSQVKVVNFFFNVVTTVVANRCEHWPMVYALYAQAGVLNTIRNAGTALAQTARNSVNAVRIGVIYVGAYPSALWNAFKNVSFTRQIVCQMANGRQLVKTVIASADDIGNQLQIAFAKAKKVVGNKLMMRFQALHAEHLI